MKRKEKESKLNMVLAVLLVVFVCLLSFSIGVISGKGWSDRAYKVRHIEQDSHLKLAMEDDAPIGEDMTEKEVELLTQRALEEAKAQAPGAEPERQVNGDEETEPDASTEDTAQEVSEPKGREASTAKNDESAESSTELARTQTSQKQTQSEDGASDSAERAVSSLMPKPTTPKPASIQYTVQVAAYKTIGEAELHSQKLIDKGFPAFPVKAVINGQDWYRVSIGSFKNRKQAVKYESALKKQAIVKSTFVQEIKRLER